MTEIFGISLNRENIINLVIDEASKQKEELKELLKGRLIYLKMDACTCHRVNYFAINVRFADKSNMVVTKTLAIRDTHAQHTANHLKNLVEMP